MQFDDAYLVRLPGTQLVNSESIYDHLHKCLEFPEYFGNNLDALYDCLTDLDWIYQKNIILFIDHFDEFASLDAQQNFCDEFIVCLYDACLTWAQSNNIGVPNKSISIFISRTKKAEELLYKLDIPFDFT